MTTENLKTKEPYYVFTSIDGVLIDNDYVAYRHGPFAQYMENPILKDTSINALLSLLSNLEEKYDTRLIITSGRRNDLPACVEYLRQYGFNYDKPFYSTKYVPGKRGNKILNYMEESGKNPERKKSLSSLIDDLFSSSSKKFKNYVVIESELSKVNKQIPSSHIIKTNPRHKSLTQEQVDSYLTRIGLIKTESQPQ